LQIVFFNATLHNRVALLNWKVDNEAGVDHYVVERSEDNTNFQPIATVKAANIIQANYWHPDNLTSYTGNIVYYRIKQVSKNGTVFYTRVLAFNLVNISATKVHAYPNPVRDLLNISITALRKQTVIISLADGGGKTVITKSYLVEKGSNTLQLHNLNQLAKGLYLLQVRLNDETVTEKITVQ
jgi:hypothetical protein